MSPVLAPPIVESESWLRNRLETLRLRLRRKSLWLRATWSTDPLQDYHGMVISDAQADRLLLPHDPHAEASFYRDDPLAASLTEQLVARESAEASIGTPISVLGDAFGLSQFEMDTLLLCAAPCLDPDFHKVFAYLQDDVVRRLATPGLALAVLLEPGEDPAAAIASLGDGAPLISHRLIVAVDTPSGSLDRQLTVDQRIVDYLGGIDHIDSRFTQAVRPVDSGLTLRRNVSLAAEIVTALRTDRNQVVNLCGRPDSGQREIAWLVSDELGLQLLELDLPRLGGVSDLDDVLATISRDALLSQLAFYVVAKDLDSSLVDRLVAPIFLVTRERLAGMTRGFSVSVPDLTAPESAELWRQVISPASDSLNAVTTLAEQFLLGPDGVAASLAIAIRMAHGRNQGISPDRGDLWSACRQHSRRDMARLAQRIEPCHTWDDMVVPARLLAQLRDLASQVTHRSIVYREWNVAARLHRGRAVSALFAGPSGTGKTMAAEILAADLDVDLYRVDLASVVDKYIGETEKRLRDLFDEAEEAGAMLLLDEADALTGRRTDIRDSHDRYANINVSYLLQRMEDFTGLVILATNRRTDIDRAFLRRLRFVLEFPFPSAEDRQRIWLRAIPSEAPRAEIDVRQLGQLELSGGSIRNVAVNAAFLAAAANEAVSMRHLMLAAARECSKIDKLITPAEFGLHYSAVVA